LTRVQARDCLRMNSALCDFCENSRAITTSGG
jgi:hypothetical protein